MIQPKIAVRYEDNGDAGVVVKGGDFRFTEDVYPYWSYSSNALFPYLQSHDKRVEKAINRCLKKYYAAWVNKTKSWEINLEPKPVWAKLQNAVKMAQETHEEAKKPRSCKMCAADVVPDTSTCFFHGLEYPKIGEPFKVKPKPAYKLSPCQGYKCPNWSIAGTSHCFIHSPEYPKHLVDTMTQHGAAMRRAAEIEIAFRKKKEGKMNDLRRNA